MPSTPESAPNPLLEPVSIEALAAISREWNAHDRGLTAARDALERGIASVRDRLEEAGLSANETAGAAQPTPEAAIVALTASADALDEALAARVEAHPSLDAAYEAAEQALVVVDDVRAARRAVVFISVMLSLLLGSLVFEVFGG